MPHIFFEPLEKRQSTQTLFPTFGNTAIAIYSAPVPEYGVGIGYTPPSNNYLLYGINPPSIGYSPWSGGGLFGWSNPFSNYNPWSSWGSSWSSPWSSWGSSWSSPWGSGSWSSPFGGFFGGFFGGLFGGLFGGSYPGSWGGSPSFPDIRLLYGVFPNPTPPTDIIAYYGVGIPSVSSFSGTLW